MSIIKKITDILSGSENEKQPGNTILIVDATSLGQGQRSNSEQSLSPRDQISVLQQLSRVNQTELFAIEAIFEGEPLRKVEHGHLFDEIIVYYQENAKDLPDFIFQRAKANSGKQVIVITSDRRLEERLTTEGIQTLRSSTFKKAFSKSNGRRDGRRRDGGRDGNRRRRQPRQRNDHADEGTREPRNETPKESNAQDDVSQLIDLVD